MLGIKIGVTVLKINGTHIERLYFPEAYLKRNVVAIQDRTALENNSYISVRIFDMGAEAVSPGDKLLLGEVGEKVNYRHAMTVTSVRCNINEDSATSHIRLICS